MNKLTYSYILSILYHNFSEHIYGYIENLHLRDLIENVTYLWIIFRQPLLKVKKMLHNLFCVKIKDPLDLGLPETAVLGDRDKKIG